MLLHPEPVTPTLTSENYASQDASPQRIFSQAHIQSSGELVAELSVSFFVLETLSSSFPEARVMFAHGLLIVYLRNSLVFSLLSSAKST